MAEKQKILIIDDDKLLTKMLSDFLTNEHFNVFCVSDGARASEALFTYEPDCILLDIMLPGIDGYQLCREFRQHSQIPIIMISAKGEVFDKVLGLEMGADDYLVKPFDNKELIARIKALLRRCQHYPASKKERDAQIVKYPGLTINQTNYSVVYLGKPLEMPPKELELLYFLASSPNRVFTREQLLDHIWGYEYMGDTRTVDVHIKRIRAKIKDHANWKITTVWGVGYKFQVHA